MTAVNPYAQYRDEFWSSVADHVSGACLTKFCLYCAANGVHLNEQERTRELTAAHHEALRESRAQLNLN